MPPIIPAPADQGGITQAESDANTGALRSVTETAHGFVAGEIVRYDGANWVKAQADSVTNAGGGDEAIGIIDSVTDVNTLSIRTRGIINLAAHGLTPDAEVYLSEITAGALTSTAPTSNPEVVQKMGIAVDANNVEVDIDNGFVVP